MRVVLSTNRVVSYTAPLHDALATLVDLRVVTADLAAPPGVGYRQVAQAIGRHPGAAVIAGDFGRKAAYGAFVAARRRRARFIFWTDEHEALASWRGRWLPMASRRFIARRADAVLACGPRQARWAVALGASPDRVFTFYYPVLDWPEGDGAKEPHDPLRLLCLARLVPGKGQDLMVEALATMTALPWRATIAGDGPDAARIRGVIARHGLQDRVTLQEGWVDAGQRRHLFRSHDILVLPSRWEAWGLTVVEAEAWGLPVVVSANIGAAEGGLVPDETGVVVDPLTPDSLAHALTTLIRSPDRVHEMSAEAGRWARRFTLARQVEVFMDAIRFAAGQPGR